MSQQILLSTAQLLLCTGGVSAELEVTEELWMIYEEVSNMNSWQIALKDIDLSTMYCTTIMGQKLF